MLPSLGFNQSLRGFPSRGPGRIEGCWCSDKTSRQRLGPTPSWSTLRAERDSDAMKLYGFPPTRSIRVLWTLRELDVDFEFVNVDPTKGELQGPEFLAVNPAGKLPALVD